MEGFTYNNIFETKGIEYIIIILFLSVLVPVWYFISKPKTASVSVRKAVSILTAAVLRVPQGLYFSKNHTWAHLLPSGLAKIGLDDFLVNVIGNMEIIPLKTAGDHVKIGDPVAEIIQNGKLLKVNAPVSGQITDVNFSLNENPGIISDDPYSKGWFYQLKPDNWKAETSGYYLADEAASWIAREVERLKDFLNVSLGKHSGQPAMVAFQEGGELRGGTLEELQPEVWADFQEEFLN